MWNGNDGFSFETWICKQTIFQYIKYCLLHVTKKWQRDQMGN